MRDICPFCHCDPFEYVDVGVGMVPVAITCCELGVSLFDWRNKPAQRFARKLLNLRRSHSPRKKARYRRLLMQMDY